MRGILAFAILWLGMINLYAQEYKFRLYNEDDGLTDKFINTINQDENGYLVIGTGAGIGIYDGEKFEIKTIEDNIADNYISSSLKDSEGNIWFGHIQGGISKYENSHFEIIHPGDGIDNVINGIQEDSKGNIWFSSQGFGVFVRALDKKMTFFSDKFENRVISSIFIDENDLVFVGVDNQLEIYKIIDTENGKTLSRIQNVSTIEDEVVKIVNLDNGNLLVATRTTGMYTVEKKEDIYIATQVKISNLNEEFAINNISISAGRLWISTDLGLFRSILTNNNCFVSENYKSSNGLSEYNTILTSFVDREGVLWIGTMGDGLYSKGDNLFTFYFRGKLHDNKISYLIAKDTELWTAGIGVLRCYDKQYVKLKFEYTAADNNLPNDEITCFYLLKDSTILVGTKSNGFYYKFNNESKFSNFPLSDDVLAKAITSISADKNDVWIGTENGAYQINIKTQKTTRYSMGDGLSHNEIKSIYCKNNKVYIGTNSAFLNIIENGEIIKKSYQGAEDTDYVLVNVTRIFEDPKENVWVSSEGEGVFCFNDTSILHFGTEEGLFNNYCYGIVLDNKNKIWISHESGISSIDLKTMKVEKLGSSHGLDARFCKSAIGQVNNEVWFGTQNGVVKYNSKEATKNITPPITILKKIAINDEFSPNLKDTTLPSGEHNLVFIFKGISLKNTEGLLYNYILEGYDNSWSKLTSENKMKYTKVREGNYTFKVKSYNADGVEGNQVSFQFKIRTPFYKRWWFYPSMFVFAGLVMGASMKYREQKHLNYLKDLSTELDLRTAELVDQKEKMEEINKDLTDSINYAQRIQSAILPEIELVNELFPQNFIIFKPRDIVSGDFYWIAEYFGKKIIVFADCTGHGVPGGFMSMIGRILLRETCTVKNLRDPGVILNEIDKGLVNVLKQKDDYESNKDGMDLGVCVIDSRTNILSYAGAMRPLYIYRDGFRNVLKGNRFSVGGISHVPKVFEAQTFQLEENDTLYMFSDGYPDQFGGSRGRKMKISVLNELLDQVSQMPFEQQGNEIDTFFETWKRNEPQMDDVLMIGVKI